MNFGGRIRELRHRKNLTLRDLAKQTDVTFTYLSKIENQNLSFGEFPSSDLITKLAKILNVDADELLLLAEKIPDTIRNRILERPDVFLQLAALDDRELDEVLIFMKRELRNQLPEVSIGRTL